MNERDLQAILPGREGPSKRRERAKEAKRVCICGHERRHHEHCSDAYPALCIYEVSPGDDYPICSCLDFEEDV